MAFSPDAKDTKDKAAFLSDLAATKAGSFGSVAFNDAALPAMKLGLASPTPKDATEMETEEERIDADSAPPSAPPSSTQPGYKGLSLSKIPKDAVPIIPEGKEQSYVFAIPQMISDIWDKTWSAVRNWSK